MKKEHVFSGCIPALMTPCDSKGKPDFDNLVAKGNRLIDAGMSAVVYCGSMGDWPLLTDNQRQEGVSALISGGIPVIVGTGAQNSFKAVEHAIHAKKLGAKGLMIIPRVLSRGSSPLAQRSHFAAILESGSGLPSVIYNSPYYGFETNADMFFNLRQDYPHLVGFKEFGGSSALSHAAEHITSADEQLALVVGVDTQVFHGMILCGAIGVITGIGNVLPEAVLRLYRLCCQAVQGDLHAKSYAWELDKALEVLSKFDEGPDLVLFYKYLLLLNGEKDYEYHFNPTDSLSSSQKKYAETQFRIFNDWWDSWDGADN